MEEKLGVQAAIDRIIHIDSQLKSGALCLSSSRADLDSYAENLASKISLLAAEYGPSDLIAEVKHLLVQHKLEIPTSMSELGLINRASTKSFWSKQLRRLKAQTMERIYLDLGTISKKGHIYCSEFAQREKSFQDYQNQLYLENTYIKNSDGEQFSLSQLAEKNITNPKIRRSELMARLKGFEQLAQKHGHTCIFYTVTAPSRMHSSSNGRPNPKYDGTTPKAANDYLLRQFSKVRATLHKKEIQPYGFRVVEPHKDATPHHHYLFFIPQEQEPELSKIIKNYALQESPNERGASKYRFKAEIIDPSKGSATGYVAKYISKSIDGHGIENDNYGQSANVAAKDIKTWASLWGVRQFQQIGGPPVTVWRELRRLCSEKMGLFIGAPLYSADSGKWCEFVESMGGAICKRSERPIQIHYQHLDSFDTATGEVIQVRKNRYGEPKPLSISGIILKTKNVTFPTRFMRWHPIKRLKALECIEGSSSRFDEGSSVHSSVYSDDFDNSFERSEKACRSASLGLV